MHDARDKSRSRTRWRTLSALAGAIACIASGSARLTAQDAKPPAIWDGVYSEAQAARGTPAFDASCANCHALEATGNRPLSGDQFWQRYTQRTVADLLAYIRASMPNNRPGSLTAETYTDIVALILKSNGFPAGAVELTPEAVAAVHILPKQGATELPANAFAEVVGCLARNGTEWVLTNATAPQRIDKGVPRPEDATRPLGDRTIALKFVLTKLDPFVGQRLYANGMLMGEGGSNGLNVTTVNRVAESCP